jgi:hypothetical protein
MISSTHLQYFSATYLYIYGLFSDLRFERQNDRIEYKAAFSESAIELKIVGIRI